MRTLLLVPVTTTVALLAACFPVERDVHFPVLADVSSDAGAFLSVVDRGEALAHAIDADMAPRGHRVDLAAAPGAAKLQLETGALGELSSARSNPFEYVVAASAGVAAAQAATIAVMGPPAIGIGVVSQGQIRQLAPNVWQASETVPVDGVQVTGTFTVAWVGVGWLADMRLSSSDGAYDDDVWFIGYLSEEGGVGWWDIYDQGEVAGVVEWVVDGQGTGHLGIAAVKGPHAGSTLSWFVHHSGYARVDATDGPTGDLRWVAVEPDGSGAVQAPEVNGGAMGCWDVDYRNTPCPE